MIDLNNHFKDPELAKSVSLKIFNEATNDSYHFMEFCGGHTHAIFRHGVHTYLPKNIKMIHGPGCPVCVLPIERIDYAIYLAKLPNTTLTTYGDLLRIPGNDGKSLLQSKSDGASVQMVYSALDAVKMARENPLKNIIFYAIGFETTTPMTAHAILTAKKEGLKNFFVVCNHVLTPAAITHLANLGDVHLDGMIGPAHVSTIIGSKPYEFIPATYKIPVVISGLEPLDVLISILMLVRQTNEKNPHVGNQFIRAVNRDGNKIAQDTVEKVFKLRDNFKWRGLGNIPQSALEIKSEYAEFDMEKKIDFTFIEKEENKACLCPSILRGLKNPLDCKLFGKICHPENPIGSCMVSSEGACSAYYTYGRFA